MRDRSSPSICPWCHSHCLVAAASTSLCCHRSPSPPAGTWYPLKLGSSCWRPDPFLTRIVWQRRGFPARFLTYLCLGASSPSWTKPWALGLTTAPTLLWAEGWNRGSLHSHLFCDLSLTLWEKSSLRWWLAESISVHINFRGGKKILEFEFTFYFFAALAKVWISLFTQLCPALQHHTPGSAADELTLRLSKVLPSGLMGKLQSWGMFAAD